VERLAGQPGVGEPLPLGPDGLLGGLVEEQLDRLHARSSP
jgi:hypothetical protein